MMTKAPQNSYQAMAKNNNKENKTTNGQYFEIISNGNEKA